MSTKNDHGFGPGYDLTPYRDDAPGSRPAWANTLIVAVVFLLAGIVLSFPFGINWLALSGLSVVIALIALIQYLLRKKA
jgi:hypothetical protein